VIISQTPYRVIIAGGGTDLPAFYQLEYGAVLSLTINKHMYVTVGPRFDATTRVAYTRTEIVGSVDELQHSIVREALRMTGLGPHLEITTVGDVPAGTGLGSSSSLTVGLLNALYGYQGRVSSHFRLAEEACRIEIDVLGKPIGRQDQYAAAFGGVNYIRFNPDGVVDVEPVPCTVDTVNELQRHVLMMYTGHERSADHILKRQSDGTRERIGTLREMRDLACQLRNALSGNPDIDEFARLLHIGWELKRSLGFGITTGQVDEMYAAARAAGAMGGKLLGAGGGGFLLIMAPPARHEAVREALKRPIEIDFGVDRRGSRLIFVSDH
jgi:D-glycero-alpha-D-manno-heptose-7-phosphate kinase